MFTNDVIFNLIGLVGDALTLWIYFLLQTGKVKHDQLIYSVYNLVGAVLILTSLLHKWNLPSAVIEISWILISGYGVYVFFAKHWLTPSNPRYQNKL